MKHLETLQGKGFVPTKSGKTPVEYELRIYQQEIRAKSLENPSGTIPGLKEIHGWVRPFCGSMGEALSLEMQDGRTVSFFFTDSQGSIAVRGSVG